LSCFDSSGVIFNFVYVVEQAITIYDTWKQLQEDIFMSSLDESVIPKEDISLESELDQVITTYNVGPVNFQSIDDSFEGKDSRPKSIYTFLRISLFFLVIVIKALSGS